MSTPTDIITYIGIPLAVLGALPILFTCIRALFTLRSIQRELNRNGLEARARGSFLSGIVEIEHPRFSITPLERTDTAYWKSPARYSLIRGGSWTVFNWDKLATGHSLYRLQYKDELRQPQAEVDFEELVAFLLDRGAVPSKDGFRMLRTSGLWTPTGTRLLLSPDTCHSVLKVAPADDSDGSLSLSVRWEESWNGRRMMESLPPYWMRIDGREPATEEAIMKSVATEEAGPVSDEKGDVVSDDKAEEEATESSKDEVEQATESELGYTDASLPSSDGSNPDEKTTAKPLSIVSRTSTATKDHLKVSLSTASTTFTSTTTSTTTPSTTTTATQSIRLRLTASGLTTLLLEHHHAPFDPTSPANPTILHLRTLPHLTPTPTTSWFATLALSIHLSSPSSSPTLPSYHPPPYLTHFALSPSLPIGVLCLLSLIPDSAAPAWHTPAPNHRQAIRFEDFCASSRARAEEARLPPALAAAAAQRRQREDSELFSRRCREDRRERETREELRLGDALRSGPVGNAVVGDAWLGWLRKEGKVDCLKTLPEGDLEKEDTARGLREVVGCVVWRLVMDEAYAEEMVGLFERWRGWAEGGGMNKADYLDMCERKERWAEAGCALALVRAAMEGMGGEGTGVAADMQDCLKVWSKVRIG